MQIISVKWIFQAPKSNYIDRWLTGDFRVMSDRNFAVMTLLPYWHD